MQRGLKRTPRSRGGQILSRSDFAGTIGHPSMVSGKGGGEASPACERREGMKRRDMELPIRK